MLTLGSWVRAAATGLSLLAVGCAGESGYNVDLRNDTGGAVRVELKAAEKDKEPEVRGTAMLAAGASTTMFTNAAAKAKVSLEARLEGDATRPPFVMPITLGRTNVDIIPPTDKQAKDPKMPAVRLREREGH
jgi:hypothetical protein